jgi:hypothetical protein
MAENELDEEAAFAAAMRQIAKAEPVRDEADAEHGATQALKQLAPTPEVRPANTDEIGAFYDYEGEP